MKRSVLIGETQRPISVQRFGQETETSSSRRRPGGSSSARPPVPSPPRRAPSPPRRAPSPKVPRVEETPAVVPPKPAEAQAAEPSIAPVCLQREGVSREEIQMERMTDKEKIEFWDRVLSGQLKAITADLLSEVESAEGANVVEILFNEAYIPVWRQAFTQISFDPINSNEVLEYVGDKALGVAFAVILIDNFAAFVDEDVLTSAAKEYMSKSYQARLSTSYNLPKFILRRDVPLTVSMAEDAFESFFGALYYLGDVLYPGAGALLVKAALTKMILPHVKIDNLQEPFNTVKEAYAANTHLLPTGEYSRLKDPKIVHIQERDGKSTTILVDVNQYTGVNGDNPMIDTGKRYTAAPTAKDQIRNGIVIAQATACSSSEATNIASKAAIAQLRSVGMTDEKIRELRALSKLGNDLYSRVIRKAKSEGYDMVELREIKSVTGAIIEGEPTVLVFLIGIKYSEQELDKRYTVLSRGTVRGLSSDRQYVFEANKLAGENYIR